MEHQLFSGGDGSKSRPFLISTALDLSEIRNYSNSCFRQINDIDMKGIEFEEIEEFSGSYNGSFYAIKNLKAGFECLFLIVSAGALVERVRLVNSIDTKLAHTVDGKIDYCSIEGKVLSKMTRFGGFISTVSSSGKVSRCSFVDGAFIRGGFCYRVDTGGVIEDCYVRKIYDLRSNIAGSFVDYAYGSIYSCYSDEVSITTPSYHAGGFSGEVKGVISDSFCSNINIKLSFTENASDVGGFSYLVSGLLSNVACIDVNIEVVASRYVGGIVGILDSGELNNFFNDTNISHLGNIDFIGEDVAELRGSYSITQFNMTDKWNVKSNIFNGKPYIKRFWEGTHLPVNENPWAVKPEINDGMPYLKRPLNVFAKTIEGEWVQALSVFSKTEQGWVATNNEVKAKTSKGWK